MRLFPEGIDKALPGWFDRVVTFERPSKAVDEFGQRLNVFEAAMADIPCAIGDRRRERSVTGTGSYAQEEPRTAILLPGSFPDIETEWRATVDGVAFEVVEVTPSQSGDVTEVAVRRWSHG